MQYEFDGYSEASSNSPGRQATNVRDQDSGTAGGGQSREERREEADGFYRGTGRFARENSQNEARDRTQQQRPRYVSPYQAAFYDYVGLRGPRRSEAEWSRIFAETYARAAEDRGGRGDGGGRGRSSAATNGADVGYAGYGESYRGEAGYGRQGHREARGMDYEEFLSTLFGGGGGVMGGGGSDGRNCSFGHGPEAADYGVRGGSFRSNGGGGGGGGGPGIRFEEVFGSPCYDGGHDAGAYGGGRGGGPRRGGAGMTREEFDDLFRARFEGPSPTGYASGSPPADLFDRWHSDW